MSEPAPLPPRQNARRLLTLLRDAFPLHLAIVLGPDDWLCLDGRQIDDGAEIAAIAAAVEAACPREALFDDVAAACAMVELNDAGETLVRYVRLDGGDDHEAVVLAICRPRQTGTVLNSAMLERISTLTRREAEIAVRLAAGDTLTDISSDLSITIHTARNQLKSAMRKAKVHSQAALVACLYHWLD